MRLFVAFIVTAALGAVAWHFYGDRASSPVALASVVLSERGFVPSEVYLSKGGTVTFSTSLREPYWPASNDHPTHLLYPEFDPKNPVAATSTWSFRFDRSGDWGFHDHLRPYFLGIVHVAK